MNIRHCSPVAVLLLLLIPISSTPALSATQTSFARKVMCAQFSVPLQRALCLGGGHFPGRNSPRRHSDHKVGTEKNSETGFSGKAPQTPNAQTVNSAIQNAFGTTVEPVTGFSPYFVTGDFNGDRSQDVAVVVRLNRGRSALGKDVRVINPFGYGAVANNTSTLALAIIHGDKPGWQTSNLGTFIVQGESPILILQSARATSGDEGKSLMYLKRKSARRPRNDPWPPRAARGDGVVLETEAIDSILYWDGKTYRWLEGEGGE